MSSVTEMRVSAAVFIAALAALPFVVRWVMREWRELGPAGKHAGNSTSRDEETEAWFAEIEKPAEIASEPPWWTEGQEDRPREVPAALLAAPVVHHGDYSRPRYDGHAESSGGFLVPLLAPASAAVRTMRGLLREAARIGAREAEAEAQRLRDEVERLKNERDYPHLLPGQYGAWVTGEFKAVDDEMVRAAMEQGEVA